MADADEQRKAKVITKGHNLLILGRSGTGKSYTANNAAVKLRKYQNIRTYRCYCRLE